MPKKPVISPELDLRVFCYRMLDKTPDEVGKAAYVEAAHVKENHLFKTKESNFRKGSKGRRYCDDLHSLMWLLVNGELPKNATPGFMDDIRPLMKILLKKWRVGNLEEHFSD